METHDYEALARQAYPVDETLDTWAGAFARMVAAGAQLVLLWGMRDDDAALPRLDKARAEAEAAGKDGDKAVWQARKAPQAAGWRKKRPTAQEVVDHLCRGGWVGIQPHSVRMVLVDVDEGGEQAADQAEHMVGCRALYRQPTGTPGRLHLAWAAEGVRGRKWKVPAGGGEFIREGNQAVVWHPVELADAVDAALKAPVALVERLNAKGDYQGPSFDFEATTDTETVERAIDRSIEAVETAQPGERNDTVAAQAWRGAGLAASAEGVDVEAVRARFVEAAVKASPDEAEKAADTANRQYNEGLRAAASGLRFEVRVPVDDRQQAAFAADAAIAEEEVVTEDDVEQLEAWQAGAPLEAAEPPEMLSKGEGYDVARALMVEQVMVPDADADNAREVRKGGILGFDSHRLGASLVAHERAFAGWRVAVNAKDVPSVWEWRDGAGWRAVPWKLARTRLAAYLEPRHYTVDVKDEQRSHVDDSVLRGEQRKTVPRPTTGGSTGMALQVAKMMAGLSDFYTEPEWHDWNPLVAAHPDGSATDFLTGERRPQRQDEMAMKRTGVNPAEQWRGTWFEARLMENVPSASDRLLLQCLLGAALMGRNPGEAFIWLVGPGGSGKDSMAVAVAEAIGPDYTSAVHVGRILSGRSEKRSGDSFTQVSATAVMQEARLVVMTDEPDEDDVLDQGAYKSLSGGGVSSGRRQGKDVSVSTRSGFTCLATANRLPFLKGTDPSGAIAGRTCVISFPVARRAKGTGDARVKAMMLHREHLASLLAFIVEGACLVAQCGGLPPLTEQQKRRARMPTAETRRDRDQGRSDTPNYARDLHLDGRNAAVCMELQALWKTLTEPDPAGFVWLDERADGSDAAFLGSVDAVLTRHQLAASAENRAKFFRRAGFEPVRRRGIQGTDYKHQGVPGAKVR